MRQNDEVRDDVDEKADGASERTNDYSGRIEETNIERKVEAKSNCLLSQNGPRYESGICESFVCISQYLQTCVFITVLFFVSVNILSAR